MKPEETFDYHIKVSWQKIARYYGEKAKQFDATMSGGYVLLNIDSREGTPSTALGPKMGVEATSLSRTLNKLEEKGLIYRRTHSKDGRSVIIKLTKEGEKMRRLAREVVIDFNEKLYRLVSEKERRIFFETLQKINEFTDRENE